MIPDIMNLVANLMQFVVAGYALRLNRLFGPNRVGWSLFCAFSLLALLHLVQSMNVFKAVDESMTTMRVMYALISLLLLIALAHIETLFKERLKLEQEEIHLRARLEAEVEKKTAHLTRAIEALQTEIDERKRMQAEVEAHVQLLDDTRQILRTERANCPEKLAHIRF